MSVMKFRSRETLEKMCDINTNAIVAQDLDIKKGNKRFYNIPINELDRLAELLEQNNHLYEILPPDYPVKMYFDLEMEYTNADFDKYVESITENEDEVSEREFQQRHLYDFMDWLKEEIYNLFDVQLRRRDFVVLDSSRPNKLSYHLIIPNHICFKNVADHKIFTTYIWSRFQNPKEHEKEFFKFLTYSFKEETRFIFDKIPYGKFQNVRFINQSKKGKSYILKNINRSFGVRDSFIRLYEGVGDRKILNVEPLVELTSNEKKKTSTRISKEKTASKRERKETTQQEIGFNIEGMTLMTHKKMKYEDVEKIEPSFKKYLYLIPNTAQSWEIYRNIGFAIKSCGGTLEDYKEWAKLSTKYNEGDEVFVAFNSFRTVIDNERTYDVPYLRRLAKLANPDFFKREGECLDKYFKLDTSGIETIVEHSKFVSQEGTPDENNILHPAKHLILHAYLGRGKTTAIKRLLPKYDTVLFLSPRQTFARFVSVEFDIPCYLDGVFTAPKLVISVESLLKLTDHFVYQYVCLDECESIFTQFSSPTTRGKHVQIWDRLMEIIENAEKVVFADAFITNRTLDFVRELPESKVIIQNNTPPVRREAEEVSYKSFPDLLRESINNNEKNYVCYSSATILKQNMYELKTIAKADKHLKHVIDKTLVYHARADDKLFDTLKDINNTWREAKLVITSPSNTVGCSYSPADFEPDFDRLWIHALPTCCVRDTFQTQMRVRHLKQNKLTYCFADPRIFGLVKMRTPPLFELLDEYENFNKRKKEMVYELIDKIIEYRTHHKLDKTDIENIRKCYDDVEETPLSLRKIMHFNLFEQTLSTTHYKQMFVCFLDRCGYSRRDLIEDDSKKIHGTLTCDYDNLESVSYERMKELGELIENRYATETDKLLFDKYWFDKKIDKEKTSIFLNKKFNDYLKRTQKDWLRNMKAEMKGRIDKVLECDYFEGGGFDLNPMKAKQLEYIMRLNVELGINNTSFNCSISRENIMQSLKFLKKERANIHTVFNLRDWSKDGTITFKSGLQLLDKVYGVWSGFKFTGDKRTIDRHGNFDKYDGNTYWGRFIKRD